MCMFSNLSRANGTTYVFCYDMVTILHVEYVKYMYFSALFIHISKVYTPRSNLILSTTYKLSQNNQFPYFCPIVTTRFHLAAEPINRLEFVIPL